MNMYLNIDIFLSNGEKLKIDNRSIISFSQKIMSKDGAKADNFGIISNQGQFTFYDYNDTVLNYIKDQLIVDKLLAKVYLINSLYIRKSQIGQWKTYDWKYDNYSKEVNVILKDDLIEWQDITISGFDDIDYINSKSVNAEHIYNRLHGLTPLKYNMPQFDELDSDVKTKLQNTVVYFPYLNQCSLWHAWSSLCILCGFYIYSDNQGKKNVVKGV